MKIHIQARNVKVTKALQAHVELQLGFALSRYSEYIKHVTVHLLKSEEQRDSKEKLCRITVGLQRCIKVQETDTDVFAAITRATDRVTRSIAYAIKQEHIPAISPSWSEKTKTPRPPIPPPTIIKRGTAKKRYSQLK
ncbi:MAG: ribosome-associated translation inhibitor RaiA [Deltaproteobacteria bacterium]|nr:ribosome-associated translation inhibitor RaiA [Deltaproteobacteria bacterium]